MAAVGLLDQPLEGWAELSKWRSTPATSTLSAAFLAAMAESCATTTSPSALTVVIIDGVPVRVASLADVIGAKEGPIEPRTARCLQSCLDCSEPEPPMQRSSQRRRSLVGGRPGAPRSRQPADRQRQDLLFEVRRGAWYGWPDFIGGDPVTDPAYMPTRGPAPRFMLANHAELPPPERPLVRFPPHTAAVKLDVAPEAASAPAIWSSPCSAMRRR